MSEACGVSIGSASDGDHHRLCLVPHFESLRAGGVCNMHRKQKRVAINLAAAINLLPGTQPGAPLSVAKRFALH